MRKFKYRDFASRPTKPTTPQCQVVLDYVKQYFGKHHIYPSREEICKHMGWSYESSVLQSLQRLVSDGHMVCNKKRYPFEFELRHLEPLE